MGHTGSKAGGDVLKGVTVVAVESGLSVQYPPIEATYRDYNFDREVGSNTIEVYFGYNGDYSAAAHGLVPAELAGGDLEMDGWMVHEFQLEGEAYFQALLYNPAESVDFDLYLVDPQGQLVVLSEYRPQSYFDFDDYDYAYEGTEEWAEVDFPADGTWSVYVYAYSLPSESAGYQLLTWTVSATPGVGIGDLKVTSAPKDAEFNALETVGYSWSGAPFGQGGEFYYLGAISHTSEQEGVTVLTTVEVDNTINFWQ